ncbi:MAG: L,D-transpeptidase family protein [Anaerolineae bacterium]|nr:L,D-transpeptidase family protein [Anaerolineae bacterium]
MDSRPLVTEAQRNRARPAEVAARWIIVALITLGLQTLVVRPALATAAGPTLLISGPHPLLEWEVGPVKPANYQPAPPPRLTVGASLVNVRSGPSATTEKLGSLARGEEARITGVFSDWWRIWYQGREAWISRAHVAAFDAAAVPEVDVPLPLLAISPDIIPAPATAEQINEPRWINVDLSEQRLTAYENGVAVNSYLVSTGLPGTPTPEGQFRIWIKLRYDDMEGDDYFLEDVPYVMYFYEGYGLHGVWWHGNFGNPMSHGCINQPNEQAAWLFEWANVGVLVNVHP